MRKFLALALLLATSLAAAEGITVLPKFPGRGGYAFDKPRILLQQRLFGLYHGVSLLAGACDRDEAVGAAYRRWRDAQGEAIAAARNDLGRYYFGRFAAEATDSQLAQALGLKQTLDATLGKPELGAACATLPEALAKPRYDLAGQFRLQVLLTRLSTAAGTEGRVAYCRRRLDGAAARSLDQALQQWQAEHLAGLTEARTAVEPRWREAGLDRPLEDWLQGVRKAVERSTLAKECAGLEAWLATPEAHPDQAFKALP
ncbi:hypothetical protein [Denitratisoma oestradiolicum]|uniref:Uncharacterized protein n=1 Tax=Denitratisoma oestradiolicum TaxID=311182 RepID=A0A6S6Y5B8_9PROT|nr:hypothetical protein [Denitratisoma oestradiolicum]TWO81646.1 hypothetical protein CBW56_02745 [Denitratisoma oestradiolicum]CAB1370590.1 conserved exported protein of unknown function [Denitratisoma oestradiolicum]